jgi:hypothetical protein
MAKLVKFTPEVVEFILQKMSEGYDISQITKNWPDKVPHKDSIYRKSLDDPEFAEKVDQAYTILLMHRLDELHEISSKTAVELYPDVEDWRQAEATLKRRMDAAKFVLGKMAPVLSKRFDKTSKVEISGELAGGPQIAVINYYQEPVALQPAVKVIDHDKQD